VGEKKMINRPLIPLAIVAISTIGAVAVRTAQAESLFGEA
jgi:hypothetical protein